MDFYATREKIITKIREISSTRFEQTALEVFRFQAKFNLVYKKFIELLSVDPEEVKSLSEIPFLPITLFKKYTIKTGDWNEEAVFTSSGTTQQTTSKHFVRSVRWYDEIALKCFEDQYGDVSKYCVLALLPSYLEREGSSLVHMAQYFIEKSNYSESGFFLYDHEKLSTVLQNCVNKKKSRFANWGKFCIARFC